MNLLHRCQILQGGFLCHFLGDFSRGLGLQQLLTMHQPFIPEFFLGNYRQTHLFLWRHGKLFFRVIVIHVLLGNRARRHFPQRPAVLIPCDAKIPSLRRFQISLGSLVDTTIHSIGSISLHISIGVVAITRLFHLNAPPHCSPDAIASDLALIVTHSSFEYNSTEIARLQTK